MRSTIIVLVSLVVVGCNKLGTKPKLTATEIFDLRTKCQDIVDKDVREESIGMVGNALTAGVTAHYNPATNRCYARVSVMKILGYSPSTVPDNYRSLALYDAQTRNLLLAGNQAGNARTGRDLRK